MKKRKIPLTSLLSTVIGIALSIGLGSITLTSGDNSQDKQGDYDKKQVAKQKIYDGDDVAVRIKDYIAFNEPVPYGTDVDGVLFNGYPMIIKKEGSRPIYSVKAEKNVMVRMRDGVHLAVDVFRPDADGRFPALLGMGWQGKDLQEMVRWLHEYPQQYFQTPFWDGMMEAGNTEYLVPRGYIHVVPEPRNMGKSEGISTGFGIPPEDTYDVIEWIASQPWCNGKVGMIGPSAYSITQMGIGPNPPPHLTALFPVLGGTAVNQFTGMLDLSGFAIGTGRHGNDSGHPPYNTDPRVVLPDNYEAMLKKALSNPDLKYNSKFYSLMLYPKRNPSTFSSLLSYYGGTGISTPGPATDAKITIPIYLGGPWSTRFYLWGTIESFMRVGTPAKNKKLILCPPAEAARPWVEYHDEVVRWYDYWLKGIDTGILDEPAIKCFVMGVNKWKFEKEWPLARTQWTKYYLHAGGSLSTQPARKGSETFTQPAPYMDPTVYCLTYATEPFANDTEVTGPVAVYLDASISTDDTNWMVDLVDVDPKGNKSWLSAGYLKAQYKDLDETKSTSQIPVHRRVPAPVVPGQVNQYAISMMPTSVIFQKGHRMQFIIRNQDDLTSGYLRYSAFYFMPFMRTVTHTIHMGNSYLLLPMIPAKSSQAAQN